MLVTFNQAKELKELGYDEETQGVFYYGSKDIERYKIMKDHFSEYERKHNYNKELYKSLFIHTCSAPFVSSALQWVRENKGIVCCVDMAHLVSNDELIYFGKYINGEKEVITTDPFSDYPSAESGLLTAILEYLKEKK